MLFTGRSWRQRRLAAALGFPLHGLHQPAQRLLLFELGGALVDEILVVHAQRVPGLREPRALPPPPVVALALRWSLPFLRR